MTKCYSSFQYCSIPAFQLRIEEDVPFFFQRHVCEGVKELKEMIESSTLAKENISSDVPRSLHKEILHIPNDMRLFQMKLLSSLFWLSLHVSGKRCSRGGAWVLVKLARNPTPKAEWLGTAHVVCLTTLFAANVALTASYRSPKTRPLRLSSLASICLVAFEYRQFRSRWLWWPGSRPPRPRN